ncbi:MAG: hypothetical protein KUG78_02025 [Kangiellaceae bacterium]|nr:hypothetical protein [Kangiellaceae bacterium]
MIKHRFSLIYVCKLIFVWWILFGQNGTTLALQSEIFNRCFTNTSQEFELCALITPSADGESEDAVYYRYSVGDGYQFLRHYQHTNAEAYRIFFSKKGTLIAIGEVKLVLTDGQNETRYSYKIYRANDFLRQSKIMKPLAVLNDRFIKDIHEFTDNGEVTYGLRIIKDGCLGRCPVEIDGPLCIKKTTIKL